MKRHPKHPLARIWAFLVLVGLGLLSPYHAVWAEDAPWNQFRGPRGDGSSTATNLPATFAEGSPEIVWKTPIPGRGWSSPVVWGNRVYLTSAPEIQNLTPEKPKLERPLEFTALCIELKSGAILYEAIVFEIDL